MGPGLSCPGFFLEAGLAIFESSRPGHPCSLLVLEGETPPPPPHTPLGVVVGWWVHLALRPVR